MDTNRMITTFSHFGYDMPVKECYNLIKQTGFDGVTLWWSDDFGNADYRDYPELARKAGLFIENIHAPFGYINNFWLDDLDGVALTDDLLKLIDDCVVHEFPTVVLHLTSGDNPPPHNELGLNRIKRLVDKAEKHSINIAFENLRRTGYLEYVLSNVDSPYAGFCYDSGHHNCRTPNDDLLSRYGSRLMALHLHDNDGFITGAGEEDQHKLPFDGTINWPKLMNKLSQSGYTGAIAIEASNLGHENLSPEAFLHLAYERAKKLEGLLCL